MRLDAARTTTSTSALGDDAITVGSFNFAESEVLAEIYSQALEAGRLPRAPSVQLGPAGAGARPRLRGGLLELVPEYAGTALNFVEPRRRSRRPPTSRLTHARLDATLAPRHVTALTPAPAQDANTFVVTRATALGSGCALSATSAQSRPA